MPPRAAIVYRAREEFLPGSRLTEEQHGRVSTGNLAYTIERVPQHRTVANDLVETVECLDLFAEVHRLGLELRRQTRQLGFPQAQRARLAAPVDGVGQDLREELDAPDDLISPDRHVTNAADDQGAGA